MIRWFLFFCTFCLGGSAEPVLLYLKGTCSSGKSTLIHSLRQKDPDLVVIDEDAIMQESYVAAVEQRFSKEFTWLKKVIEPQNLYHALREKEILFRETSSEEECLLARFFLEKIQKELDAPRNSEWKEGVSKGIEQQILQKIEEAFTEQRPVLLDSWYIKISRLQSLFPKMKGIRILLYCPLPTAFERLLKRNREADLNHNLIEKRYLRQLIGSFCSMYRIDEDPSQALETISKGKWEGCLEQMFEMIDPQIKMQPKPLFTALSLSREQFVNIMGEFFKPLKGEQTCFLHPKEPYDLIFDSTDLKLQEIVEKIHNQRRSPSSDLTSS